MLKKKINVEVHFRAYQKSVADAFTHLNYAFAYIDPSVFTIMTMDVATPVSLFDEFSELKVARPDLKLFVSIGGWTFSDNDTDTQPVFGNIARSASNRQSFATNLLAFLNEYGFDGVDIDWYDCPLPYYISLVLHLT